jgi:hypothetical protein
MLKLNGTKQFQLTHHPIAGVYSVMNLWLLFALSWLLGSVLVSRAQGLQVDQSWVAQPTGIPSLLFYAPVGQEFTPSLDALDAVEFLTGDFSPGDLGASLVARIRSDNISGPILATSITTELPSRFSGTTKFEFPSLVPVIPGHRYVMEIQLLGASEGNNWGIAIAPGPYAGGALVLSGERWDTAVAPFREGIILDRDLWLNEKMMVPEPSTSQLVWVGAGLAVFVQSLERFRRRIS